MPLLDVGHLKEEHGQRVKAVLHSKLPNLVLDDQTINMAEPAHLELTLTNIGAAIVVEGIVTVKLSVSCHRCLDQFNFPLQLEFYETYYDSEQQPGNVLEDQIPYTGDEIDITPEVLSAVDLHLPMRFICASNCRGLCQHCGTNWNVNQCQCEKQELDPRLAKLKNLL